MIMSRMEIVSIFRYMVRRASLEGRVSGGESVRRAPEESITR